MIAVERDGVANPRQLHVGAQGLPLTPAGWIVSTSGLAARSAFAAGTYGLSVGKGGAAGMLEARWRGNADSHKAHVTLLTDGLVTRASTNPPLAGDAVTPLAQGVAAQATLEDWQEGGLDIAGAVGPELGIGFTLDALLPPRHAWIGGAIPAQPNAYWLQ
jgi:hypothetical protein